MTAPTRDARLARLAHEDLVTVSGQGAPGGTWHAIGEIARHREMLNLLIRRDLKSRYKDSVLGFAWALVRPIFQLLIYFVIIGKVMGAGTLTRPDRLYRFASSLADSLQASPDLASAGKLVKLAASLRHADLGHIKFVSAPTTDFPVGDPNWGRLQFTPEAQVLWDKVKNDEPLGRFGKGAVSGKNPNGGKDSAAENGLCA